MEHDTFSIIKGRYLVIIWLLPLIYLPGAELFAHKLLDSTSEWYWYDIYYIYYYHAAGIVSVFILIYLGRPNWRAMLGSFTSNELIPSLKLTAFVFIFSIAAAYLLFYPLSFYYPNFVNHWFIELPPIIYSQNNTYPFIPNFLSFLSLVIIAPIVEEFIFRGLLLHRWNKKWGLKYAILLSSLLFGIIHPDPIGATAFGIAMCILYLRTQSLLVPVICHATNNLVIWLFEVASYSYYGPEFNYTLEHFQSEWLIGVISFVISMTWVYLYFAKTRTYRRWSLPNA